MQLRKLLGAGYRGLKRTPLGETRFYSWAGEAFRTRVAHVVLKELKRRGVRLEELNALEVFAGFGTQHMGAYANKVASLVAWEIEARCEGPLRTRFPRAEIKITDAYQEIKRTPAKFDFIVVDNWFGRGEHPDHYDLFPDIFRVSSRSCIWVLTVLPDINGDTAIPYSGPKKEWYLQRRRSFHNVGDPLHIPVEQMVESYRALCASNGYNLDWHFFKKRSSVATYLVLKISNKRS